MSVNSYWNQNISWHTFLSNLFHLGLQKVPGKKNEYKRASNYLLLELYLPPPHPSSLLKWSVQIDSISSQRALK